MREVFPVKYYKDEGFVERKIELDDEDLDRIIEEYLRLHAEFDFDEIEIINNRPMNIWLREVPQVHRPRRAGGRPDNGCRGSDLRQVRRQPYRRLRSRPFSDVAQRIDAVKIPCC